VLFSTDGTDVLHGGAGNDAIYHGASKDNVGLHPSGPYAFGEAYGDAGDDILRGGETGTSFFGGTGNDTIAAHAGDDTIDGGDDNDLIVGGTGADTILGGSGNDAIYTFGTLGHYGTTPIEGWEQGSINPYGDTDTDTVDGGAGDDFIYAGAGDDIDGGANDDVLILSVQLEEDSVATTFDGGAGHDRAAVTIGTLQQHEGDDGVDFHTPITFVLDDNVTLFGLTLLNIEMITFYSGAGDDEITGGIYDDYIDGKGGDDFLHGRDGHDNLYGGTGNDTFDGGLGHDLFDGGDDFVGGSRAFTDTVDTVLTLSPAR
jgi:Ca2+-binding RTX toxin-like protein